MKTRHDGVSVDWRGRNGSVLIVVMIMALLVPLVAGAVVAYSRHQAATVRHTTDIMRAKAIAEAGAAHAYTLLSEDFGKRNDPSAFPQTAFAGGTFDATIRPLGAKQATIISTGIYAGVTARVVVDIVHEGDTLIDPSSPWAHTLFVNGTTLFNGSGTLLGSIRCNRSINQNGSIVWGTPDVHMNVWAHELFDVKGNSTLHGSANAPAINFNGSITHRNVGPVPQVPFPVMDLTPYYNIAVANGQVFNGGNFNSDIIMGAIPGGVRWYNGNVTFRRQTIWQGTIIATGNIEFRGSQTHTRVGNLPAVISRDGNILLNGSHTINGLVYAGGDVRMNGSGTINGGLVVGGDFRQNGSYGVIAYENSYPTLPGQTLDDGVLLVKAWQE